MTRHLRQALTAAILSSATQVAWAQKEAPVYQLERKISLTGDGKWDYMKMDETAGKLYVSHFDRVHVIDMVAGAQIGEIDSLHGVHGITFSPDMKKGYISNGKSNEVTVFDPHNLKVLKNIAVSGKKPDCIITDKASGKIFVFCADDGTIAIIDPLTDTQTATLNAEGSCEFAVADGKGLIYNNLEDKNEVIVIDSRKLKIVNRFPLKRGTAPTGIAMDKVNKKLFIACSDSKTLVVMDALTGREITAIPIGENTDGVVFDKDKKMIITSNGEGTATFILQRDQGHYQVSQTIQTEPGMKTIEIDEKLHHVFISGGEVKDGQILPDTFSLSEFAPQE